jgi:photosystem II stability/assembly factor-like uncharacterized protein
VRRHRLLAGLVGLQLVASVTAAVVVPTGGSATGGTTRPGPHEAEDSMGPGDGYLLARSATGGFTAADFAAAGRQRRQVASATRRDAPGIAKAAWRFQGPTNIGGRVVDLALDPRHVGTVYVATAGGGLWRTTDGGRTFAPRWPRSYTQALGAVAMSRDGTLYAGAGETNPGGGSITYGGDGIYRSTDGGRTWRHLGLRNSGTIARIVVDPLNPRRIYVAVSGNLYVPGGQRGLYVSNDRGASWQRLLAAPNATTGASDVAVDPKDPRRIYVGMWDHVRHPDERTYTGVGSGLWMTTNRGQTWTHPTVDAGLLPDSPGNGRIGVTVDPVHPANVYLVYANDPLGLFEGFFTSTDHGTTWSAPPQAQSDLADSQYVYGWWFAHVWVDPSHPSHVFLAGLDLYESTDSGASFAVSGGVHADQHAMAFDPRVKNLVYLGDDGGFYRSTAAGATNSWLKASYEPWTQFDGLDVSDQDPSRIVGGLQDNGSVRSWGPHGRKQADWTSYYGGDGQQNLVNPKNKDNVFACLQYGDCAVSTDGGDTMNEFDQQTVSDRHNYFTPMAFDPSNPSVVYYAGDYVNKSVDGGNTWVPISNDLGNLDPGTELNPLYAAHYGTVTTLAISAKDPNVIWAGTDNGLLWKTTTGTLPWTRITSPKLPVKWVSHVAIDPADANHVFVSYSGFREGDRASYLFETRDGGTTWRDMSANLPQAPVNDVVLHGHRLYVASDVGVFTSDVRHVRWYLLGHGLPDAPVTRLRYVPRNGRLYISTFGRSVWSLSVG